MKAKTIVAVCESELHLCDGQMLMTGMEVAVALLGSNKTGDLE